jgi:hypothetical protein
VKIEMVIKNGRWFINNKNYLELDYNEKRFFDDFLIERRKKFDQSLKAYEIQCMYRYRGGDEKDYYFITIMAPNEELAIQAAIEIAPRKVYKTYVKNCI